jgi:hypothetical protein
MFEQSRAQSALGLQLDTVGGLREYRIAPEADWRRFLQAGGSAAPDAATRWRPGDDQHMVFDLTAKRDAHVVLLVQDAEGRIDQVYPNYLEQNQAGRPIGPGAPRRVPDPRDAAGEYYLAVSAPAGTVRVKAFAAARPFRIAEVPTVLEAEKPFPPVSRGFKIMVEGDPDPHDSFDAAFGDLWQTDELQLHITAPDPG